MVNQGYETTDQSFQLTQGWSQEYRIEGVGEYSISGSGAVTGWNFLDRLVQDNRIRVGHRNTGCKEADIGVEDPRGGGLQHTRGGGRSQNYSIPWRRTQDYRLTKSHLILAKVFMQRTPLCHSMIL